MTNGDRTGAPAWPRTYRTPTHDLEIGLEPSGGFYVMIHPAEHTVAIVLAYGRTPGQAMQNAAVTLADAGATLRRGLRRLRRERRRQEQATTSPVTGEVDNSRGRS